MTSAALQDLSNRIATNTLTPGQQGALVTALAGIIPTFPTPDELSNSIPSFEEGLSREWFAALYSISFGGGAVIPVPNASALIVPDGPTLSNVVVTTMLSGQPAIVQSFGAEFSLQPIGDMVVDGSTVLLSTDPARVWERGDTIVAESAALQTAWFVDSVAGNDNHSGLTALLPVKNKAEIARRWGTWSPTLTVTVTITYLSNDTTAGADVGRFAPVLVGGQLIHTAALPAPTFTGTLNVVTAKSVAGNQALRSTFNVTTGAIAANMMLVNATRGNSYCFVQRNTGGATWQLTQPLAPYSGSGSTGIVDVDTWTAGDAISGFVPIAVDLGILGGECPQFNGVAGPGHLAWNLTLLDTTSLGVGFGTLFLDCGAYFSIVGCVIERGLAVGKPMTTTVPSRMVGCAILAGMQAPEGEGLVMGGGYFFGNLIQARGIQVSNDLIFAQGNNVVSYLDAWRPTGPIFIDTGTVLFLQGTTVFSSTTQFYGPGTHNQRGGSAVTNGAATFASTFNGVTLQLDGVATGYSNVTAAGVTTVHGGIALSAANLDAAAGAAGFGGYAFGGGAAYSKAGVQP